MTKQLTILATDNYPLPAFLFTPTATPKASILLCPGLGIPKEVYRKYGIFLAEQGYLTLLFDYRGIGKFNPTNIPNEAINLRNWGRKDMVGAANWLKVEYPNQKLYLFGHSVGGQIAGLMDNYQLVDRYIFFCSTAGHWRLFDFPLSIFSWFMWHLHLPITSRIFGYLPPSLTYRGVSIAKGVALEWAAWSRKKAYIAAFFGSTIPNNYYEAIRQKIDLIHFTDDPIATERAMTRMMAFYKNAPIERHAIDPKKRGLGRIGHSGFFSSKVGKELWTFPLTLIEGKS